MAFKLDRSGMADIAKSDLVRGMVRDAAAEVARNARAATDLPVTTTDGTTDRAVVTVTIAHRAAPPARPRTAPSPGPRWPPASTWGPDGRPLPRPRRPSGPLLDSLTRRRSRSASASPPPGASTSPAHLQVGWDGTRTRGTVSPPSH